MSGLGQLACARTGFIGVAVRNAFHGVAGEAIFLRIRIAPNGAIREKSKMNPRQPPAPLRYMGSPLLPVAL
jgi:hypothetical protein